MADILDRFCVRECLKDGEAHKFAGRVKLVLVEPSPQEETWRKMGASFVATANLMIGANLGIMIVYSLSYKLPMLSSAHALFCTLGTQLCLPFSILMLHSLNGASALMKKEQRRCEHTLLGFMSVALSSIGGGIIFLENSSSKECWHHIHVYGAYVACCSAIISVISGFTIYCKNKELESPFLLTCIHNFFGMTTLFLSAFTYITSLYGEGGCKNTFRLWMYAIGYDAPLYMMYFVVIFYTCVVVFIPGSKFIIRTKYNC